MKKKNPNQEIHSGLLKHAIDASSCAITIADAQAKDMPLIYINEVFTEITGYSSDEVVGKNCRFLQGDDNKQPVLADIRKSIKQQKSCTVQLKNYRKDGTMFWNELHLSPVLDNQRKLTHYVGVQTDITRRVEAEQALKSYQDDLEGLILERTRELRDKNAALQELLSQIEIEKKKVKERIIENVDSIILPLVRKIKTNINSKDQKYTDLLEQNLKELASSFGQTITRKLYKLTPKEIDICNMIKSGLSSKDIAQFYHSSLSTVENQRNTIRKKLGISKCDVNLTTYLQSLSSESKV